MTWLDKTNDSFVINSGYLKIISIMKIMKIFLEQTVFDRQCTS